jgi:transcriptional regulator with PAS, ATPase and Fis domain
LQAAVKAGRFRSDLYYRLNVYPIPIPPLRERLLDIPPLVDALVKKFCTLHEKRIAGLTDKALQALKLYPWPGNIRELENMIERGIILASAGGWIEIEDLFPVLEGGDSHESGIAAGGQLEERATPEKQRLCAAILESGLSLEEVEALVLREAVSRAEGNLAGAARLLGMTRPQLNYRLKRNEQNPQG